MKNIKITIALLFISLCSLSAKNITITITNPLNKSRLSEMAELSLASVRQKMAIADTAHIIVLDANGQEIPSQATYDGKLIFQVSTLAAKQKVTYSIKEGSHALYINKVYGRQYPERQEDFSFENDKIGYRLYGPATQKKGERLYGYDLFNKRTEDLILDKLYADQTDGKMWDTFNKLNKKGRKDLADALYMAFCYHIDHGQGMDCYKVGPTLGAGTNGIIDAEGNISYPWCYQSYEILDNGPLRLTVRLDYGSRVIDGKTIHETRLLTIDAGTNMIKSEVTYTSDEGFNGTTCAGIVIHTENPNGYKLNEEKGCMAYEDLGDVNVAWEGFREKQAKEMGKIYIGTFVPSQDKNNKDINVSFSEAKGISGVTGHILTTTAYKEGRPFVYYFGSGWDRNPNTNFKTLDNWFDYLLQFEVSKDNPLKIAFKK